MLFGHAVHAGAHKPGPLCGVTGIVGAHGKRIAKNDRGAEERTQKVIVGSLRITSAVKLKEWDFGIIESLGSCPRKGEKVDFVLLEGRELPHRGSCITAKIMHGGIGDIAGYQLSSIGYLDPANARGLCGIIRKRR